MRVLLVANQTLASRKVFERILELSEMQPGLEVHIVVPVSPTAPKRAGEGDMYGRPGFDFLATELANRRLEAALSSITELGLSVTGELGHSDPVQAVRIAMRRRDYGRIILSTLPSGASRWLKMDLIHRIRRMVDVSVDHILGEAEPASAHAEPESWQPLEVTDAQESIDILIVDDNRADIELTTVALGRAPVPCRTRVATSGSEAIEMVQSARPDLVLLDLNMPGMSGIETLERFGQMPELSGMPVVIITTSDRDEDRERTHALGAAAYIVKENDFALFEEVLLGLLAEVAIT